MRTRKLWRWGAILALGAAPFVTVTSCDYGDGYVGWDEGYFYPDYGYDVVIDDGYYYDDCCWYGDDDDDDDDD